MGAKKFFKNKKVWINLIIALAILVVFLRWINIGDAVGYLYYTDIPLFIVACFGVVALQTLRGMRFDLATGILDAKTGMKKSILVQFATSIVALSSPARMGEGGKIFFFRDRKAVGATVAIEKLLDFAVLGVFSLIGLLFFMNFLGIASYYIIFSMAAVVLVVVLVLLKADRLINLIFKSHLGKRWLMNTFKKFMSDRRSYFVILYTTVILLLSFVVNYVFILSLGLRVDFFVFILIIALSQAIGFASGIPGGLGLREFTYTFMLVSYTGLETSLVGASAVVMLLGPYIVLTILALLAGIALKWRTKK